LTSKQALAIVVSFIMIAGLGYTGASLASGEKFEYEVPHAFDKWECETFYDGPVPLTQCYMEGVNTSGYTGEQETGGSGEPVDENPPEVDGCPDRFDRDGITGKCRPISILEAEAIKECEEDRTCPLGDFGPVYEPPFIAPKLTNPTSQITIQKINEYLGSRCFQGIGTTLGIQEKRSFEIPTITATKLIGNVYREVLVLDTTGFTNQSLEGLLGIIERHVRECVAQALLLNPQGGVLSLASAHKGYCDSLVNSNERDIPVCGYTFSEHRQVAKNVPVWSQQRVNENQNRGITHPQWSILEDVCKGYYERSYKMIFDECVIYFSEITPSGSSKKPTMFDYGSEIEAKLNQYLEDDGVSMVKELTKDKIAKAMAELRKQLQALENQK